jgi:23S rRNA (cytosine1962-C5)-methyltransferase
MKQQRGYPRVTVTPKAERGLTGGHPWVYDTEVADAQPAENGALVDVISAKGRFWQRASSPASMIVCAPFTQWQ